MKIMFGFCILFCLYSWPLASFSSNALTELGCGPLRVTQWRVEFKTRKLFKYRYTDFQDPYCEPAKATALGSNGWADFMDAQKTVIWSKPVQIPERLISESFTESKPAGHVESLRAGIVHIKIPRNEKTEMLRWIKVRMNDGREFGPASF